MPGRESFDIEIYGMVGVPEADLEEWRARKERRGQGSHAQGAKRPKIDKGVIPIEQLKAQLEAHKALMSGKAPPPGAASALFGYGPPPTAIGFPPNIPPPGFGPPPGNAAFQRPPPPFSMPPPGMNPSSYAGPPPGFPFGPPPSQGPNAAQMSLSGASLPSFNPHEQAVKQGSKSRMVYADTVVSPEEKLASTSKYRYVDPENPAPQASAPLAYPPPNYGVPPPGFAANGANGSPYRTSPTAAGPAAGSPHAQSYPAMSAQAIPPSSNSQANTAEALAAANASTGSQQVQEREADMSYMQSHAHAERVKEEAVPEPVGMTEAVDNAAQGTLSRPGRARAADLF